MQPRNRIGIRREDKNMWERRVPLIPAHVKEFRLKNNLEITIQPSQIRIFQDEDYLNVGARVNEDLSSCQVIMAVKEIPSRLIEHNKVYIFFSHTTKGQSHNMPMLRTLAEKKCTLIDYEKISDQNGNRLVFFGIQAGQAGMLYTLWAYGQRMSREDKKDGPFLSLKQACHYGSLVEAKEEAKKVGWEIYNKGLPPSQTPLICGFMGYGHVSRGAQEIFDLLPVEEISPGELEDFFKTKAYSSHKVYKVIFKEEHMVKPQDSSSRFNLDEYYQYPERYISIFDQYLEQFSILMNCIYWSPQFPHFVSLETLKKLWADKKQPLLKVIGDISCDIKGTVECNFRTTTPDNPVYIYNPEEGKITGGFEGRGVAVMAIDNLPAVIPLESSVFFSKTLKPYIPLLDEVDFGSSFESLSLLPELKKAVILYQGEFTPSFSYMKKFIENIPS